MFQLTKENLQYYDHVIYFIKVYHENPKYGAYSDHYCIRVYFKKKAAADFKTGLSLRENAEGLLTHRRLKNATGGVSALQITKFE